MEDKVKIRYTRLNQVCTKALQQSINRVDKWEKLSSCFPDYASTEEGAANLKNCQKQVVNFWKELCKREFGEIFKERDIEVKLNDLDQLIHEAKVKVKAGELISDGPPIDKVTPERLITGNIHDLRQRALKELNIRLETIDQMNTRLREEIEELNKQIDDDLTDLQKIYDKSLVPEAVEIDDTLAQGLKDMLLSLEEDNY